MALGQEIPPERSLLYVQALSGLTEPQLKHGFEQALKHFKPEFGKTFPYPGEIQDWALQWKPAIDPSRDILDRNDKPPGWHEMGRRSGVTKAEIDKWLEEGKQKQIDHIAKLEADPEWRKMAKNLGAKLKGDS